MKMPNKAMCQSLQKQLKKHTYNFFDQCCFRLLKEFNTALFLPEIYCLFLLFNIEHSLGIPHVMQYYCNEPENKVKL